jgi:hypothetical protein
LLCGVVVLLLRRPPANATMAEPTRYWFPAKRYGWGWGLPTRWQGRVVLAVYLVLLLGACITLLPAHRRWVFVAFVIVLNLALLATCYATGEPPRWRWGRQR